MELEHGLRQIDFLPLINVVFLLLIFFMLTLGFIAQPGIKVNLPRAITSEAIKFDNLEILITKENGIYLNRNAVTIQELKNIFNLAAKRKQAVLIKADKSASLGILVEIWDMARDIGISGINIATNQK